MVRTSGTLRLFFILYKGAFVDLSLMLIFPISTFCFPFSFFLHALLVASCFCRRPTRPALLDSIVLDKEEGGEELFSASPAMENDSSLFKLIFRMRWLSCHCCSVSLFLCFHSSLASLCLSEGSLIELLSSLISRSRSSHLHCVQSCGTGQG